MDGMTLQQAQTKQVGKKFVLAIYVRDLGDSLRRITSILCRRGFRLESLSTSPTEHEHVFRVMVVIEVETGFSVDLLQANLAKLRNVSRVEDVTISRPPTRNSVDANWIGGP